MQKENGQRKGTGEGEKAERQTTEKLERTEDVVPGKREGEREREKLHEQSEESRGKLKRLESKSMQERERGGRWRSTAEKTFRGGGGEQVARRFKKFPRTVKNNG